MGLLEKARRIRGEAGGALKVPSKSGESKGQAKAPTTSGQ